MERWGAIVETGGGAGLWMGLAFVAFLTGSHLDAALASESERAHRRARWLGLLALFLTAAAGVALAWGSPHAEARRWQEAAVWWVPSIIV
ncbi:MAG TPA: hypothetical protein VLA62_04450, partial [Solirubrobacterales bacterium]|nr:hypothetical protein [Solirubrobacterales bacterium]